MVSTRKPLMQIPATLPTVARPRPQPASKMPAAPMGAGSIRTGLPAPAQLAPGQAMTQKRVGPTGLPAAPKMPVGRPSALGTGMMSLNRTRK